jgi:hypothetical protein
MARSSAESAGSCFIEQIPSTHQAIYAPAPKAQGMRLLRIAGMNARKN